MCIYIIDPCFKIIMTCKHGGQSRISNIHSDGGQRRSLGELGDVSKKHTHSACLQNRNILTNIFNRHFKQLVINNQ